MPNDLSLVWNQDLQVCEIGFSTETNDLVMSKSLLTSVLVSLFTDARASNDETLPDQNSTDRRGWWGDATNTQPPRRLVWLRLIRQPCSLQSSRIA